MTEGRSLSHSPQPICSHSSASCLFSNHKLLLQVVQTFGRSTQETALLSHPLTDVESLSKQALLPRVQCLVKPNVHNFSLSNPPQVFCIFVKKIESKSPKAYRQSFIESAQKPVPCQHQRLRGIWSHSCWCSNHRGYERPGMGPFPALSLDSSPTILSPSHFIIQIRGVEGLIGFKSSNPLLPLILISVLLQSDTSGKGIWASHRMKLKVLVNFLSKLFIQTTHRFLHLFKKR